MLPNLFYKTMATLISKVDWENTKKINHRPTLFGTAEVEIQKKISAN